jgi:hypothetical protein
MSTSFAEAVMETARGFNEGRMWAQDVRGSRNTTGTTLEQFAAEVFAPAVASYAAAQGSPGR